MCRHVWFWLASMVSLPGPVSLSCTVRKLLFSVKDNNLFLLMGRQPTPFLLLPCRFPIFRLKPVSTSVIASTKATIYGAWKRLEMLHHRYMRSQCMETVSMCALRVPNTQRLGNSLSNASTALLCVKRNWIRWNCTQAVSFAYHSQSLAENVL